jgi:serine/threonine protein kinase
MLYYIATGTYPFHIETYKQLTEVLNEERLKKLSFPTKIEPKLKDLLRKIFVFDPAKRYSIADVLTHPFITG